MAYSQPAAISLQMSPAKQPAARHGRAVGAVVVVLVGHVAAFAGLASLQPTMIAPVIPKPIEIRMVTLAPPPPPPELKVPPKPKLAETPKFVPVVERPPVPTVQPKRPPPPVAKPIERVVEPVISVPATVSSAVVAVPVPAAVPAPSAPVQPAAPVVQAAPAVVVEAPVNQAPRTVSIDGVAYKRQPQIQYPDQARRRGDTGTVVVRALIGTDGRVDRAEVEQSSGHRALDQAGLRAVHRASFHPYRENGVAQPVYTLIPIAFTLNED